MTYNEILTRLSAICPEEYEFEARVLIESFTSLKISYLYANPSIEINSNELERALEKREARIPLQYIVGSWDFYRQTYRVDENCLIPRADTEVLVEKAIELLPPDARFLDLCTGSGCIAVSTLAERRDTQGVMVDKFEKTLALARFNAEKNGVLERVKPLLFDVLCEGEKHLQNEKFDAILSNPPYIRTEVISTLSDEVRHEPLAALDGGEDGLIFYSTIVRDYSIYLKKGGFFLFEIGFDQAADLQRIANKNGFSCEIYRDLGNNDRVALLKSID